MRFVITALIAMTCLAFFGQDAVRAQTGVAVAVRNKTDFNFIVKGYTFVGGVKQNGMNLQLRKRDSAFENAVPAGTRYYTLYNPSNFQPILRDVPINVGQLNLSISVIVVPGKGLTIVTD